MKKYFFEIDVGDISDKFILLDIDGTIASDQNESVDAKNIEIIRKLEQSNNVFLLSNNRSKKRIEKITNCTRLAHLPTQNKKPSKKILSSIEPEQHKKILVIGDKYLTDVLFAQKIGAPYIKVRRLTEKTDRFFVTWSFWFDDLVYFFMKRTNFLQ